MASTSCPTSTPPSPALFPVPAATTANPLPLIHLNGFPGVGKLTIARALQQRLGAVGRLVHNHMLINPADAVLHRTEEGYQDLRRAIRSAVFASLADSPATYGAAYIFTDFQSGDATGSATCAEYLAAARARRCALISIVLTCEASTNLARLQSPERAAERKLVDPQLLTHFRNGLGPHHFEGETTTWSLDVSDLSAAEASLCILEHILDFSPDIAATLTKAAEQD